MKHFRIGLRLTAGFALMAVLALALGLRGLDGVDDALDAMDDVASTHLPAVLALADLRYNLRSLAVAERNLLIPDFQARDSVRSNVSVYRANAEQALRRYGALPRDAASEKGFEAFLRARAAWQTVDARLTGLLEAWEADRADAEAYRRALHLMENSARTANLEMMDALAALLDVQAQAASAVQGRAMAHAREDRSQLLLLLAASAVLGAGLCWATTRSITRPLGRCVAFARAVEHGELDRVLDVEGRDEAGRLAESLRAMVDALKAKIEESENLHEHALRVAETARQAQAAESQARADAERARLEGQLEAAARLQDIVEAVTSASDELARQVEHSSHGANIQAGRVAEAATAMEQMAAAVVDVARAAGQAASTSEMARDRANGGARSVHRVLDAIRRVESAAAGLKEDMRQLGQRAQGIGQVMEVISDIADQTNLLALNAAIEAARAGEAGRGFAVVADEVRKLAEKTMNATREVGQVIHGIQQSATRSAAGMDGAVDLIREATSEADGSGRALGEIVALVDDACGRIQAIAAASEQQSASSEQISRTMEDIHRVSADTSSAMSQSAQAVNLLAAQTSDLMLVIGSLREVDNHPALAA